MKVRYRYFRGSLTSWDELFKQAAEFASGVGPTMVINISHSCDGSNGVVTVWYWGEDEEPVTV